MKYYKLVTLLTAFLGLLLITSIAHAQTYSWTDENDNKVRFADDFSQVPEKYKKSAVPVGPSKERLEELRRIWAEMEWSVSHDGGKTWVPYKGEQREGEQVQSPEQLIRKRPDLMEEMVRRFPGLTYEWTQKESLWIRIPASTAYAKEEYSEMAEKIASYYHTMGSGISSKVSVCLRVFSKHRLRPL